MTVTITTSEGEIEGSRFRGLDIDEDTWTIYAEVAGFDVPVLVSDHANEAAATTAMRAISAELASEGDVFPDAIFDDVTWLGTGKTALTGPRIEIGTEENNRQAFISDAEGEVLPASIQADDSEFGGAGIVVAGPDFAGDVTPLQAYLELFAEDDGSTRASLSADEVVIGGPVKADSYVDLTDTADGFLQLALLSSAPAAPASGHVRVYARVDGGQAKVCYKRSTGTEIILGTST